MNRLWLSGLVLTIAYLTYGRFLETLAVPTYTWAASAGFAIALAAAFTFLWNGCRRVVLMGFRSDAGYLIMVLVLASLAVVAAVQFYVFAHLLVLVAATLLVRVDSLVANLSQTIAFVLMCLLPGLGLVFAHLLPLLWTALPLGGPWS